MSLIDKLSQMFDDMMEKAIEHHRQTYSRGSRGTRSIPVTPDPVEKEAAEAAIDKANLRVSRASLEAREAPIRLQAARNALGATLRPGTTATPQQRKAANKAYQRELKKAENAPVRLREERSRLEIAKRKAQDLGTKKVEGPPTKQQKMVAAGKMADDMFDVKGLTGSSGETIAKAATGNPAAIVKLVTDQITGLGKGVGKFLTSEKGADATSGLFKAGFHGAMLSGPMGAVVAPFMKLGEVVSNVVSQVQDWNESLHESNIRFSEFSGAMAQVKADQMVRDIEFSQERGDARAFSADKLAKAKHSMNQAMAPIDDALANMRNELGAALSEVLTPLIKDIAPYIKGTAEATVHVKNTLLATWDFVRDPFMNERNPFKRFEAVDDENVKDGMGTAKYLDDVWRGYGRRGRNA